MSESQNLMEEIDARQNDVLAQLDKLNDKIETLLNEVRPPAANSEAVGAEPSELAENAVAAEINQDDPDAPTSQLPAAA